MSGHPTRRPWRLRAGIRTRLGLGFAVVLPLLVLSGLANWWALGRLADATTAVDQAARRSAAALQVGLACSDLIAVLNEAAPEHDPVALHEAAGESRITLMRSLDVLRTALADLPAGHPLRLEASRVEARVQRVDSLVDLILPQAEAQNWESVRFYQTQSLADYHRLVVGAVRAITTLAEEQRFALAGDAAAARLMAALIPVASAIMVLAAVAGTGVATGRSVVGTLARLKEGATRLADGRLQARVPVETTDELGELAATFNTMADNLQQAYASLENQVAERTADLAQRTAQLAAAAEIAREAAAIREADQLLDTAVRLISERFGFYHAGVFLLDEPREYAILRKVSSEGGQRMLARGHKLRVGQVGIVGYVSATGKPRIALDVGRDAVFFDNPDLPLTRSEMALPLKVRDRVIGVLDVQSAEEAAFAEEDVAVLQTMADQVALAIENARLLDQSRRALGELEALYGRRAREAWDRRTDRHPAAFQYTGTGVEPMPITPLDDKRQPASDARESRQLSTAIRLRGQALGSITLHQDSDQEPWSSEEVALAEEVGTQIALALESARLLEESRQGAEEQEGLARIAALAGTTLDIDELLGRLMQEATALLEAETCAVLIADEERQILNGRSISIEGSSLPAPAEWYIPMDTPGFERSVYTRGGAYYSNLGANDPNLIPAYRPYLDQLNVRNFCGVALRSRDRSLGELYLANRPGGFDREELRLIQAIAGYVSNAIENSRLFDEARVRAERLAVLNRITTAVGRTLDLDEMLQTVYREIASVFEVDAFSIVLHDAQNQELDAVLRIDQGQIEPRERLPMGAGFSAAVVSRNAPLLVRDFEKERDQLPLPSLFGTMEIPPSWLGVPLRVGDRVLGAMSVQAYRPNAYGEDEQLLLSTIADQVSVALENVRLFGETQQRVQELAMLFGASQALTAAPLRPEQIAEIAARQFVEVMHIPEASVSLLDPASDEMKVVADFYAADAGGTQQEDSKNYALAAYPATARVMETLQPLVVHASDPDADQSEIIYMREHDVTTLVILPLAVKGQAIGVIELEGWGRERHYSQEELNLASTLANQTAVALDNARLFEEARLRAEELAVLNELAQALSARLDLDGVLHEVYQGTSRLLDTTAFYIALYDPDAEMISYRFDFDPTVSAADQQVTILPSSEGLAGYLVRNRTGVLIREDMAGRLQELGVELRGSPVASWMGVPMMIGDRVLGVIVAQSYTTPYAYDEHDFEVMTAIASQAAIALQNAYLFEETQRRAEELGVLNELAQALSAILSINEVLEQVHLGTARLLDTSGFYIGLYDAETDLITFAFDATLSEADREIATLPATEGLAGYVIRNRTGILIRENVPDRLRELGIELVGAPAAAWMGVPLLVGDRVLGLIAAQSYTTPYAYDEHDFEVMTAIGSQAAIALQNAYLFEETQRRAEELSALNELAQTLSARLNVNEVLEQVHLGTKRLLETGSFYVGLYDAETDLITFAFDATVSEAEREIVTLPATEGLAGYVIRSRTGLLIRENVSERRSELGIELVGTPAASWMGVPLLIGDRALGVIVAQSYSTPRAYDEHDMEVMTAIAGQAAIALQNAYLFEETQRRAVQLAAAAEVARDATAILDVGQLLHETVHLISEQFGFYHAGVFLPDETNEYAELRAASSVGGQRLLERGHRLRIGQTGIVGYVTATGEPRIALDVGQDAVFFDNPDLPDTRSELAVPLVARGRVIGALDVQSTQQAAFSGEDVSVLQTMADQLATAIENARLFTETQEALTETREMFEANQAIGAAPSPAAVRQALINYVASTGLDWGRVVTYEFEDGKVSHAVQREVWSSRQRPLQPEGTRLPIAEYPIHRLVTSGQPFTCSDIYADARADDATRMLIEVAQLRSFAAIPLTVGRRHIGTLLVGKESPHTFSEQLLQNVASICGQASIAIESLRLLDETRRRAQELETLNEIGRAVTSVLDLDALIRQIVDTTKQRFGHYFTSVLLVEGDRLVFRDGSTVGDSDVRLETGAVVLDVGGPAGLVTEAVRSRQPVLVNDTLSDPRYVTTPSLTATRSEIAMPLEVKGRVIGVLDVQSDRAMAYDDTDVRLLQALASQAGVAIENARLFQETQSEASRRALMSEVLQAAAASLDPEGLLHLAGEAISRRMGSPSCVFLWDQQQRLRPVAVHASDASDVALPAGYVVTPDMDPILFDAVEKYRTRLLESPAEMGWPTPEIVEQLDIESAVIVPLVARDQALGALVLGRTCDQPPATDDDVNFTQIVATNLSVALENARLYQEAVHTAERLTEVDRLKSQFLANMSHELRTPLNSIIGFSRVILKGIDGPLTDLQRQDLDAIYSSGQHLLGLINDILDISRIEAGKMELAFEPINLTDIIKGVLSTAVALVKDNQVELQQTIPADLPTVVGDSRRVRQVLLNLVSNAAKFTAEGYIHVEAGADARFVTVSVADSGIGIPPDKLDTIFEAFTQADASPSRKYGGTGLGLSISKSFVELHGGQMWVESDPGHGSTFYFTLPIEGPPMLHEEEEFPRDALLGVADDGEHDGKLVLCIDDDEGVLTLFRRYLRGQGYRTVGLTDSTRVLAEVKRLKPYAITLDVMMPGKDGWEIIRELKADPETRQIPVVMCSIVSERGQGLSLGAADYLVKPILERDLLAALDRLDREQGRHRVLVVDDQAEDRHLLRRMIESQDGYEVLEAASGQEAIALVRQTRPHIIILDLMMPEIDGFAVLEAVKADEMTRSTPIIVVTAKELTEEDRRLLNSSIEVLIQKGVLKQEELLEDVAAALRKLTRERSRPKGPEQQ